MELPVSNKVFHRKATYSVDTLYLKRGKVTITAIIYKH
jgi:hypothetical protein